MQRFKTLAGAGAILVLTAATAFAAPCSTGTTANKMDKSSNVEPGSTGKVTPGAKAESPGTVGAMNKAGTATATSPADVSKQAEGKPTAAQQADGC
jgi:hypothetical protein